MYTITPKMRTDYMDVKRKYTFDDIQTAIDGKANYLAALGLTTYTENLGGLYCGNLRRGLGNSYISFINEYFPLCYKQVESQLKASSIGDLYLFEYRDLYSFELESSDSSIYCSRPSFELEYSKSPSGNKSRCEVSNS